MDAKAITPILNVSSLQDSFAWFENLGWKKLWDWGDPPGFGAVGSGECEIFLCQDGQGGRGKGNNSSTFGLDGDEIQDQGVWMSIWVENVDQVYALAIKNGIDQMCNSLGGVLINCLLGVLWCVGVVARVQPATGSGFSG